MTQYLSGTEVIRAWNLYKHLPQDVTVTHTTLDGKKVELLVGYLKYAHEYVASLMEEADER